MKNLLQRMSWNAEQNVLGQLCIFDICTCAHILSLLEVKSVWQIPYFNLHTENPARPFLSGYIRYYENMLKFSIGKEIIFLNLKVDGNSATPLFALLGSTKKR